MRCWRKPRFRNDIAGHCVEREVGLRLRGTRLCARVDVPAAGPAFAFGLVAGGTAENPVRPLVDQFGIPALRPKMVDLPLARPLAVSADGDEDPAQIGLELAPMVVRWLLAFLGSTEPTSACTCREPPRARAAPCPDRPCASAFSPARSRCSLLRGAFRAFRRLLAGGLLGLAFRTPAGRFP